MNNTTYNTIQFAYIHGFNSDKNSRSFLELQKIYPTMRDCYYNYRQKAEFAHNEIENKLRVSLASNKQLVLIGSSLGGYFALYFSHKYNLPAVVFNPVTFPEQQLAPFLGENYNFYTNEKWNFTLEILNSYKNFPLSKKMNFPPRIIIGTNDKTIDPFITNDFWNKYANILITTEEHSISHYAQYKIYFELTKKYFQ